MKNVIFVHGRPSRWQYYLAKTLRLKLGKFHWAGWLGRQLSKAGYEFDAPEMPKAYAPQWDEWVKEVEKFKITSDTILIGHSTGAGFWIKYLSNHPDLIVGKVVLVAPWLGYDYGAPPIDLFDNYKIDPNIARRTQGLTIFYSDNDFEAIQKSVAKLKATLKGAEFREFHNYGHFVFSSMRTNKFPELLEECLKSGQK